MEKKFISDIFYNFAVILIYLIINNVKCILLASFSSHYPRDLGSIPGHVISNTLKMVLDTSLLNTQQYKVCIKGKVEQSR